MNSYMCSQSVCDSLREASSLPYCRDKENKQYAQGHAGKNSSSGLPIAKPGLVPSLSNLQRVFYKSEVWVLFGWIACLSIFSSRFSM